VSLALFLSCPFADFELMVGRVGDGAPPRLVQMKDWSRDFGCYRARTESAKAEDPLICAVLCGGRSCPHPT
jgi:hypothetical protein